MHADDLVWALPAIALGAAVGAALVVASASRAGVAVLERIGLPGLGSDARARANALTWGAIAVLAVKFTGEAFDPFPGGHPVAAVVIGSALALGTFRLHRHSIEHEAYRTFNLIAMLLAAGSLASMSITPTGRGGRTTSAPSARPTTSPQPASTSPSSWPVRAWPRCRAVSRALSPSDGSAHDEAE